MSELVSCPDQIRLEGITAISGGTGSLAQNAYTTESVSTQCVEPEFLFRASTNSSSCARGALLRAVSSFRTFSGTVVRTSETTTDHARYASAAPILLGAELEKVIFLTIVNNSM